MFLAGLVLGLLLSALGLWTVGGALFWYGASAEMAFLASIPLLVGLFVLSRVRPAWGEVQRLSRTYVGLDSFGVEVFDRGEPRLLTWDEIEEVRVTSAWVIFKLRDGEDQYLSLDYQEIDELVAAVRQRVGPPGLPPK